MMWGVGGPGSGKGTQCDRLLAESKNVRDGIITGNPPMVRNLHHINVGGLLRAELSLYKSQVESGAVEVCMQDSNRCRLFIFSDFCANSFPVSDSLTLSLSLSLF